MSTEFVTHNKCRLALHTLRAGRGRALLLLHGLGERSSGAAPTYADAWTGPVMALDFTGHGVDPLPVGGGYTAEILLADADAALTHLGEATIVGRGLGAYVGLLLAGARAEQVHGTVLADGPGLSGGPSVPTSQPVFSLEAVDSTPDPYALVDWVATCAHRITPPRSPAWPCNARPWTSRSPWSPGSARSGYVRSSRSPESQRRRGSR